MKRAIPFVILLFLAGLTCSSCKMLRGDPRKNCNHPEHGRYMQQKRMKKMGMQKTADEKLDSRFYSLKV